MNQNERLDYLVEQFKEDSVQYRDLEIPADPAGKKRILRISENAKTAAGYGIIDNRNLMRRDTP